MYTDKVRNINRYWLDNDSDIVVRQWTDEEYKTINPHTYIFEKHWSYYCPRCGFIPAICHDKDEAIHRSNDHRYRCGNKHKCVVEYRDHKLVCLEFNEEYMEQFDVWVAKQIKY